MPRGGNAKKTIESLEAVLETKQEEILPDVDEIPMFPLVLQEVMKGTHVRQICKKLNQEGFKCGMQRTFSIVKIAKREIMKAGERDIAVQFGWAQSNLMDIHSRAVEAGDDRMRLVAIKQLIDLWEIHRPKDEREEKEITPEMIEDFEKKLLR